MKKDICKYSEIHREGIVTFYVNEKKKTVVAVLCTDNEQFVDDLNVIKKNNSDLNIQFTMKVRDEYVAQAVCGENDVFDAQVGAKLAYLRIKREYTQDRINNIKALSMDLSKAISSLDKRASIIEKGYEKTREEIKDFKN